MSSASPLLASVEHAIDQSSPIFVFDEDYFTAVRSKQALVGAGFEVSGPTGNIKHALDLINIVRPRAALLGVSGDGEYAIILALALKSLGVPFLIISCRSAQTFSDFKVFKGVKVVGQHADPEVLIDSVCKLIS